MKARSALLTLPLAPALAFGEQQPSEPEVIFLQRFSARDLLYACKSGVLRHLGRERRRLCAGFISGVEEAARRTGPSLRPVYSHYGSRHAGY